MSSVLTRTVSGALGYMINAKVGAPFANGAKQVTCELVAVENSIVTTLDVSETLWLGNNSTAAKGVIALNGVYTPSGAEAAQVNVSMRCATGGDSRTLTRGSMNVVGVNSVN